MIKTKREVFTISNGFITWYFRQEANSSVGHALGTGDIQELSRLSVLEMDEDTDLVISSNWDNIKTPLELHNYLKG